MVPHFVLKRKRKLPFFFCSLLRLWPQQRGSIILLKDLQYEFPEELIATEPKRPSRVLRTKGSEISEISINELLEEIPAGDVLVINDTKVLKRRVFAGDTEILFLSGGPLTWEVLYPSAKMKIGETLELPLGITMTLVEKGRPQKVKVDKPIDESYFEKVAELPLPPYIQKARKLRHNKTVASAQ